MKVAAPGDAPFQFPARWWPTGHPRYMDAMMRSGKTTRGSSNSKSTKDETLFGPSEAPCVQLKDGVFAVTRPNGDPA